MKAIKSKGNWDEDTKQLAEQIKVLERQNKVKENLVTVLNILIDDR